MNLLHLAKSKGRRLNKKLIHILIPLIVIPSTYFVVKWFQSSSNATLQLNIPTSSERCSGANSKKLKQKSQEIKTLFTLNYADENRSCNENLVYSMVVKKAHYKQYLICFEHNISLHNLGKRTLQSLDTLAIGSLSKINY